MGIDRYVLGIPVQNSKSGPNIHQLHPEFRQRLRLLLADPRLAGSAVYSGARTRAHSIQLWRDFLARGKRWPPVADPDAVNAAGRRGSAHMTQKAGGYKHGNLSNDRPWAYAADIYFPQDLAVVDVVLAEYGLVRPVRSERWHVVATLDGKLVGYLGFGSAGGAVRTLQAKANAVAGGSLAVDGVYGSSTAGWAASFQKKSGLPEHGDWTAADDAALNALDPTTSRYGRGVEKEDDDEVDVGDLAAWLRVQRISERRIRKLRG